MVFNTILYHEGPFMRQFGQVNEIKDLRVSQSCLIKT